MSIASVVISLDTELAWGFHDKGNISHLTKWHAERQNIDGMLKLFDEHKIPVTWAIVGHLFLESCVRDHPDSEYPIHWYSQDPGKNILQEPLWYAPDIVRRIIDADAGHDIGLHSFSHVPFGEVNHSVAMHEMIQAVDAAKKYGIIPISFVYPRESIGHINVLKDFGIKIFRRPGHGFEKKLPKSSKLRKAFRECLYMYPGSESKIRNEGGILSVTSSTSLAGWGLLTIIKKRIYQRLKLKKIKATLLHSIKKRCMVHFDAHPHNFRDQGDLDYLSSVLTLISYYRKRYGLKVETMAQVYNRYNDSDMLRSVSG